MVHPSREDYVELVQTLRDEGWLMCLDVTAVDYLTSTAAARSPPASNPSASSWSWS